MAALSLQSALGSSSAAVASTSGRPWVAAPLRIAAPAGRRAAGSERRRMSAAVQAVAAEPAVATNGAPGELLQAGTKSRVQQGVMMCRWLALACIEFWRQERS